MANQDDAIYDAVGVRIKELPLSAERVLTALQGQDGGEIVIDAVPGDGRGSAELSGPQGRFSY